MTVIRCVPNSVVTADADTADADPAAGRLTGVGAGAATGVASATPDDTRSQ